MSNDTKIDEYVYDIRSGAPGAGNQETYVIRMVKVSELPLGSAITVRGGVYETPRGDEWYPRKMMLRDYPQALELLEEFGLEVSASRGAEAIPSNLRGETLAEIEEALLSAEDFRRPFDGVDSPAVRLADDVVETLARLVERIRGYGEARDDETAMDAAIAHIRPPE